MLKALFDKSIIKTSSSNWCKNIVVYVYTYENIFYVIIVGHNIDLTYRIIKCYYTEENHIYTNNICTSIDTIKITIYYQYLKLPWVVTIIAFIDSSSYTNYDNLQYQYVVQLYATGKERLLATIFIAKVVYILGINTQSIFLLLHVNINGDLRMNTFREEDLTNSKYAISVGQKPRKLSNRYH